jgi:hypothetical protein
LATQGVPGQEIGVHTFSTASTRQERPENCFVLLRGGKIIAKQSTLPLGTAQLAAWMGVAAVSQVLCFENVEKINCGLFC